MPEAPDWAAAREDLRRTRNFIRWYQREHAGMGASEWRLMDDSCRGVETLIAYIDVRLASRGQ